MQPMKIRKSASRVREAACEPLEARMLLSASFQVVGYLPDYEFTHFNSIDLSALTQINYFSVVATATGSLGTTSASGYSFSQLQTVVVGSACGPPAGFGQHHRGSVKPVSDDRRKSDGDDKLREQYSRLLLYL